MPRYAAKEMNIYPQLVACEHCDSVYRRCTLAAGEVARCRRCDAVLARANPLDVDRWLALTVTTAIVFLIANVCPIVRISLNGMHRQATLWEFAWALAQGSVAPLAIVAGLVMILVPLAQIVLLSWVLSYARVGRRAPGFARALRTLACLRPWSMVEVAIFGILVAIIKLVSLVEVTLGAGVWATAALMVLLTVIAHRDLSALWDQTEEVSALRRGGVA
ncbi:paraquat-inducible protein A [Achromobacter sp. NPDC008082]|uniref:paraquat-inducible protein A n=1 Tax=Achromobacter sp. NPDC008082 TaxID=3363888 RepID=UPI0036E66BEE